MPFAVQFRNLTAELPHQSLVSTDQSARQNPGGTCTHWSLVTAHTRFGHQARLFVATHSTARLEHAPCRPGACLCGCAAALELPFEGARGDAPVAAAPQCAGPLPDSDIAGRLLANPVFWHGSRRGCACAYPQCLLAGCSSNFPADGDAARSAWPRHRPKRRDSRTYHVGRRTGSNQKIPWRLLFNAKLKKIGVIKL